MIDKINRTNEELKFITVKDIKTDRVSSLGIIKPGVFKVVGVLTHNSEITFDKEDANLFIKELKKIK